MPEVVVLWEFPKIGDTLFWGPYSNDPTFRVPYFRKRPYRGLINLGLGFLVKGSTRITIGDL